MDNKAYDESLDDIKTVSKLDFNEHVEKPEPEQLKHTINEAVSLLTIGKFHYIHLLICGTCITAFMSEILGTSTLMVSAKCDLDFTIYEQGFLASAGFLGVVVSAHAVGFLTDTCGRNKTLKYSVMLATICSIISIFSYNVWMLIGMRFLVGIFMNGCQSCALSYMAEFHGNQTKTKFVTILTIFFAVGAIYIPAIAHGILPLEYDIYIGSIKFSSWRVLLLMNSLPTIIGCITLPFCPESPKYLLVQGKHDEALAVLRKVYRYNTGKDESSYPVKFVISNEDSARDLSKVKSFTEVIDIIWVQTKPLFDKQRRWTTLNLSFHQFVIFFVSHGSFMWVPVMFKPIIEYSDSSDLTLCDSIRQYNAEIGGKNLLSNDHDTECSPSKRVDTVVLQLLIYLGICFGILYIIFSFIINFVGKSRLLLIWMLICGPPIIGLIWAKGFALHIVLLFLYMFYGNCSGLITSITVAHYPTNIGGMAICLVMMMGRLGAFVGSNVIGIILIHHCEYLFVMLTLMVGTLLVLWNFLPKDQKHKEI